MRIPAALAALLVLTGCTASPPPSSAAAKDAAAQYNRDFWETWSDGFAEISTYDLVIPRYGEPRQGEAILIYVAETMSERQRVKADPGKNPKSDEFSVMKLNMQRNFQTGIYDYSEMLSAFLGLAPSGGRTAGQLAKLTFTRQEWCGHMFAQALFSPGKVRVSGASYFDGDADLAQTLDLPPDAITEEGLLFWARQMSGPWLEPGQSKTVPMVTSLRSARDAHQPLAIAQVNLTRLATLTKVEVPAGEFEAETWSAQLQNGRSYIFFVENEMPHRILRWQFTSGEKGELIASDRLKYWEMNDPDSAEALTSLGLEPRAPRFVLETP
jgi:hypothetical protein